MSNFLKFYEEHGISPVSQDIGDIGLHFHRRIGLYRTLGITPLLFKNRDVLEVAPGSGYNSIVTASFGATSYDLVEPNPVGFSEMVSLFEKHKIKDPGIHFFNCRLEDFSEKRDYDIVLCEGLIPGLNKQDEFIQLIANRVRPGGILVLTCSDAVSVFFETLRRYLARILVAQSGMSVSGGGIEQITRLLSNAFHSHLSSLKGMSRPIEHWIMDNLLNPAASSMAASNEFSIEKCLNTLGKAFYFYGSSPNFLVHWGWHKEIEQDPNSYNHVFMNYFLSQRHNLLHYRETGLSNIDANRKMHSCCRQFSDLVEQKNQQTEECFTADSISADITTVKELLNVIRPLGLKKSEAAIADFIALFDREAIPHAQDIAHLSAFGSAFGRGQQYISLVKA
ncbi:MAG: class I SAM-dependent methyltransferase [Syntrophales bacterium]|jgi:2-polyprenyl-3-methyl-5-hydroxy-6-metoxy-1,4-benzoquinol methylase